MKTNLHNSSWLCLFHIWTPNLWTILPQYLSHSFLYLFNNIFHCKFYLSFHLVLLDLFSHSSSPSTWKHHNTRPRKVRPIFWAWALALGPRVPLLLCRLPEEKESLGWMNEYLGTVHLILDHSSETWYPWHPCSSRVLEMSSSPGSFHTSCVYPWAKDRIQLHGVILGLVEYRNSLVNMGSGPPVAMGSCSSSEFENLKNTILILWT